MTKKIFLFLLVSVIFHATSLYSMAQLRACFRIARNCARGCYALDNPPIHFTYTSHNKTLLLNSFTDDAPVKIFNVMYSHSDDTYILPLNPKTSRCTSITVGEGDLQRLYNGKYLPLHEDDKVYYIFLCVPEKSTDPEERQVGIFLSDK